MILTIRNIVSIIKAQWVGQNETAIVDSISIDSRSLLNDENTLFFALYGPNHDGHLFIEELIAKGVPCLHFYTMGKSEAVKTIAKAVF